MLKYCYLLLVLASISLFTSAQTQLSTNKYFTASISEESKIEKFPYSMIYGGSPFQIFGANENGFSYHQADRKESFYGRYDTNLKRETYHVVKHDFGDSEMEVEKTVEMGGVIREYINVFNGRDKKQTLYWRTLDPDKLVPSKEKTKIDSRSGKAFKRGGFEVLTAYSPDRSKLLIVRENPENRRGYLFEVYDGDFNLIWEGAPELSVNHTVEFYLNLYGIYDSELVNIQVDDDGIAYSIGSHYIEVNGNKKKESFAVEFDGKAVRFSQLINDNGYRISPYIHLSKTGLPMVLGLYDAIADDDALKSNGYFFGIPNFDTEKTQLVANQFSDDFIRSSWSKEELADYDKELARGEPVGFNLLKLKNVVSNAGGGVTMVAQNSSRYRTVGNIVLIDLDESGKANWMRKVMNAQSGIGDQYMGFSMGHTDNYLYFLFNDEKKHTDPEWNKKNIYIFEQFSNIRDQVTAVAVCDRNDQGQIIREKAWIPKEVGATVDPVGKSVQIGNSLFIWITNNRGRERVAKVVFSN